MHNIKEAFGNNLRKLRKSKKLTIDTLSEMLDITPRQLSKIESGETFLTAETLCKISVALDISLQFLFDIDWQDKFMYYDGGKYIRPHFKVVKTGELAKITSLHSLKDVKINVTIPASEVSLFFIKFATTNNMTVYVDFFENKTRDKIIKITPQGRLGPLVTKSELKNSITKSKDVEYYYVMEKIKEFSADKIKMEYIKTAIDALSNKKSIEKLKAMITGIEISQ